MEYDWDSVQVGQPELNNSQNFFRKLQKQKKSQKQQQTQISNFIFQTGTRHALHEREVETKGKQDR
jgi:hypothetical protein